MEEIGTFCTEKQGERTTEANVSRSFKQRHLFFARSKPAVVATSRKKSIKGSLKISVGEWKKSHEMITYLHHIRIKAEDLITRGIRSRQIWDPLKLRIGMIVALCWSCKWEYWEMEMLNAKENPTVAHLPAASRHMAAIFGWTLVASLTPAKVGSWPCQSELRLGQAALQATYLERDLRDHPEKVLELI